ncbi:carbohydrate ABC transporter permease [Salinibacterium sp. ZJ450]|uniref:carbohydrate ABC transporter permease n=1 Tax=Salinibacterium sp. ZJ450 TaxID=2708338 RepID=UPI001CD45D8C|nr:sugar ABC transporter permease [Salinibacterium sp. ZJ450]
MTTTPTIAPPQPVATSPVIRRRRALPAAGGGRREVLAAYGFVLPGFALYALIMLYPAVQTMLLSLRDWSITPGADSPWVGLDNYARAFADPVFLNSLVNAGAYTLVTVPLQIIIGLFLAVLLDSKLPGRVAFRVLFYLPVVTSWVVVSLLFRYIFSSGDGLANFVVVDLLGVAGENVSWFQDRWTGMIAISALGVWKGIGWSMIIFLAALTAVPKELHEAAAIDGAGAIGQFRYVSLPAIRGALATVLILLVIGGFNVFISVLLMTGGGPGNETQVPLTYMYDQAFKFLDFGYGSAVSFSLTALVLIVSVLQYWWTRRSLRS